MARREAVRWLGPGGHVVGYPIRHGAAYNVVIVHPAGDDGGDGVPPTVRRDGADAAAFCRGWAPVVQALLASVPDGAAATEWPLRTHAPPRRRARRRVALAGDAAHPLLPYTAQGRRARW